MKKVSAFKCDICGKVLEFEDSMKSHEEVCKWTKEGHAVWVEWGVVKHAPKIPKEIFGPHDYGEHEGTEDCKYGCGCWMGRTSSGGKVDPFGPCPNNPRKTVLTEPPKTEKS